MANESIPGTLIDELRSALQHLYTPHALGRSLLGEMLQVDAARDPLALQDALLRAIDALKPKPGTPLQAPAFRAYRALYHRYAEQFPQAEVAKALGLSPRQLLRQETAALQALAAYLWAHYDLGARLAQMDAGTAPASREQEIEWLRESQPREAVAVGELIDTVLQTAHPLLQSLQISTELAVPEGLPQPIAQRGPLRQALLHLLLAAARTAPGGCIDIEASVQGGEVCIALHAPCAQPTTDPEDETLAMARELVALSGGSLEVLPASAGAGAGTARLVLPAAGPTSVLFIDDNADALLLFQRHLAGSRYLYAGTRDPQEGLALATELHPCAIVLDVMLPGADGWELLGRLRANPATRGIPVMICTILSEEQLAFALGAAAFLRKPVSQPALLEALHEAASPLPGSASSHRCRPKVRAEPGRPGA